ncbi:hypothetical protein BVRB_6g143070 [Beta vulgaris subsp. vulgaris]|nr:hypothetical protein BVRB_6g143070 [Beta vulgaris subsp. vulgaris]
MKGANEGMFHRSSCGIRRSRRRRWEAGADCIVYTNDN